MDKVVSEHPVYIHVGWLLKSFNQSLGYFSTAQSVEQSPDLKLTNEFFVDWLPITFSDYNMLSTLSVEQVCLLLSANNVDERKVLSFTHTHQHLA